MPTEDVEDYTSISYLKLRYTADTFLYEQFEQDYSRDIVEELDDLFTTTARTKVHTKCLDMLTAMITSTILDDDDTKGDPIHIKTLLAKSLRLRAKLKNQYSGRIRTWKDLKNILNRAVLTQTSVIEIVISFKGLQPDPNFKHNYIHWDHYSLTPYNEVSDSDTLCHNNLRSAKWPPFKHKPAIQHNFVAFCKCTMMKVFLQQYDCLAYLPSTLFNSVECCPLHDLPYNDSKVTYKGMSYDMSSPATDAPCSGAPTKNYCAPTVETLDDDDPGTLQTGHFCAPLLETLSDDDPIAFYDPTSPSTPLVEILSDDDTTDIWVILSILQ